jgi:hypothetical protein
MQNSILYSSGTHTKHMCQVVSALFNIVLYSDVNRSNRLVFKTCKYLLLIFKCKEKISPPISFLRMFLYNCSQRTVNLQGYSTPTYFNPLFRCLAHHIISSSLRCCIYLAVSHSHIMTIKNYFEGDN